MVPVFIFIILFPRKVRLCLGELRSGSAVAVGGESLHIREKISFFPSPFDICT